jgi:hypothetical protein
LNPSSLSRAGLLLFLIFFSSSGLLFTAEQEREPESCWQIEGAKAARLTAERRCR